MTGVMTGHVLLIRFHQDMFDEVGVIPRLGKRARDRNVAWFSAQYGTLRSAELLNTICHSLVKTTSHMISNTQGVGKVHV